MEYERERRNEPETASAQEAMLRAREQLRLRTEQLAQETRTLEVLNRIGNAITSQLELKAIVQAVTDAGTEGTGARFGAFFYHTVNEQGDVLLLYTLSGAPREAFERFDLPRNTPLFGKTFRGEGVVRCDDVREHPAFGRMGPHHGPPPDHLPVRSYLAVPVVSRSREVIGGLFFGHPDRGVFDERAERLVVGIASQAAIAIDNARLYDDVRRLAEEREQLLVAERAARAEMHRVNLLKEEFLANLSHELRTPLNAILGWAQLIATGKVGPQDVEQGMQAIARNARAQAQLIDDLVDMSRIVSGKVRLDVRDTDLSVVVQQAVDTVRPSVEAKEIRLRQVVDPLLGSVTGDPTRLQQVVWNLLSNAVKFTPRGGRIDVILGRVDSNVEISVNDTGAGIPPEFLPHLFERFRQLDSSATRTSGGLGLGLSIVKQLVELHGGHVRAASAGVGQGASFTVSIPLAAVRFDEGREPQEPERGERTLGPVVDLSGLRVLVVEDETDARELIKRVLLQFRAEVVTAGNASEGMDVVRSQPPHVIVSDIGMPEVDGYQFLRRVRRLSVDQGGQVPAIALTAFARSEDRTRAMMAGYQVHLAKPIEPRELVATVANVAGRTAHDEPE